MNFILESFVYVYIIKAKSFGGNNGIGGRIFFIVR